MPIPPQTVVPRWAYLDGMPHMAYRIVFEPLTLLYAVIQQNGFNVDAAHTNASAYQLSD